MVLATKSVAQPPCVVTGSNEPYVASSNYACASIESSGYFNVAVGYANPSDAASQNFNFTWYPQEVFGGLDEQTFTMQFDSAMSIWCVAVDLVNNCTWVDTLDISVSPEVHIGLPDDTLVCDLNGFTLQPSAEAQSTPGLSWNWEPSLLLTNANTATPGLLVGVDQWYYATATTGAPFNCVFEDSIFVTATVTPIDLGPDQELCEGETVDLNCGINSNAEEIEWSTGDSVQTITVDTTGVYWVTATNPGGCERTDTVVIDIFNDPEIVLQASGAACEGQPVELTANVTADTTVAGVGWSSGEAGTTILVTEPGLYEAIAVTVTGCTGTASVSPEFLPAPVPDLVADTTLCLEEEGPIWMDVSQPDVAYQWSSGSDQSGILLSEAGVYSVTLTLLANGCQDSASIEVIDFCPQDSVYFPTAFTPNGDLVNDRFGGFARGIGQFEMWVFNRWGHEVFRSESIEEQWNGRLSNGELAPGGMYFYRSVWSPLAADGVSLRSIQEKLGSVVLIR